MHSRTKLVVTLLVAVAVVLAGCSGAMDSAGDDADREYTLSSDGTAGDDGKNEFAGQDMDRSNSVVQRSIIRTGEVRLEVDDFDEANEAIVEATREREGYVSGSDVTLHRDGNRTWQTGRVVVRIPAEEFDGLLADVRSAGIVVEEETDSEDVTDQLVDLDARLENLYAQRDRLRDLYESANETEDVLAVQERLSDTQEEIERLEAKQRSLEDRVAYSTVTVHLQEPRPDQPSVTERRDSWYETGILAAFLESIDGVAVVLRALVVGFAYALPYLAIFGVPLATGAYVIRRRGR